MLSNTLNTNEVKDSAGAEVEFQSLQIKDRSHTFAQITESPALPHRLTISHSETGSGTSLRRRSLVRVDKTTVSGIDSTKLITTSAYVVLDFPTGLSSSSAEAANVIAELTSFCATTGSTTFLYNGTGNGANALLTGGL